MSKIMSMLEKLNVIEKVNEEKSDSKHAKYSEVVSSSDKLEDNNYNHNKNSNEEPKKEQIKEVVEKNVQKNAVNISPKTVQVTTKFEKNLTIDEIYKMSNLENGQVNTVFMLGNFLNALPENLPYDVKKSTVLSIINVANADLSQLILDGEKRLAILSQFTNDYYSSVNDAVSEYKSEIAKLKKMIDSYEEQIQRKQTILNEQNHIIKYETQRINNIISFFDND